MKKKILGKKEIQNNHYENYTPSTPLSSKNYRRGREN